MSTPSLDVLACLGFLVRGGQIRGAYGLEKRILVPSLLGVNAAASRGSRDKAIFGSLRNVSSFRHDEHSILRHVLKLNCDNTRQGTDGSACKLQRLGTLPRGHLAAIRRNQVEGRYHRDGKELQLQGNVRTNHFQEPWISNLRISGREKQYKTQIKKWSLDTKYTKGSEYLAMIKTKRRRERGNPPKDTVFTLRGRPIDPKDIARFEKRAIKKGIITQDDGLSDQGKSEPLIRVPQNPPISGAIRNTTDSTGTK